MTVQVAFQGERGAYSEAVLLAHFGEQARPVPCAAFAGLFEAVGAGAVDYAIVPIENSLAGSVLENYDLLLEHDLPIIGELSLRVRHCLLALPGTTLADVKVAYSHPQALAQSAPFLLSHGITPRPAYDTAGAARELADRAEPGASAIASARAAEIYGLTVLASDIQTRQDNTTRFFVIARERPEDLPADKASLVFAARNVPGSLHDALGVFAERRFNLSKIESRPTREMPWEYYFYVDFEGPDGRPLTSEALSELLSALSAHAVYVRLLGTYPRARGEASMP